MFSPIEIMLSTKLVDALLRTIFIFSPTCMYIVSKIGNLSNLNLLAKARIYSSILSSMIPKFPLSFSIDGTIQYKSPTNANKNNNIIKRELFLADIFNRSLK